MNNKEKLVAMIQQGSNTSDFTYYNSGYSTNPYFGASSFYGEQCRIFEPKYDLVRKEHIWFMPRSMKALGRQTMI